MGCGTSKLYLIRRSYETNLKLDKKSKKLISFTPVEQIIDNLRFVDISIWLNLRIYVGLENCLQSQHIVNKRLK